MAMQMNINSTSEILRYWNAVPTGMSMEVPGTSGVTELSELLSLQISPCPSRMY
jgi:hypothetical protein